MISPTLTEFNQLIGQGIALVDFDLPWCASGRIQERIIDSLARQFCQSASVVAVDVDKIKNIAVALSIHHVPTLVLFKKGKEIQRFVGLQSEETLGKAIENALE
jgi:thioredoxin 1